MDQSADKRLAIVADDFGKNNSVNEAIIRLGKECLITGAAIMPNGRYLDRGLEQLAAENINIDYCAHLNITDNLPLLANSFSDRGISLHNFLIKMATGTLNYRGIRDEFTAQIDSLLDRNIDIVQLNTHHHIHYHLPICSILIDIAQSYKIPFIRMPFENFVSIKDILSIRNCLKRLTKLNQYAFSRKLSLGSVKATNHFSGLYATPYLSKDYLNKLLNSLNPGLTELVCHPTYDSLKGDLESLQRLTKETLHSKDIALTSLNKEYVNDTS